ncbi:hypothetical protein KIM67_01500 [Flagellimonas sp. 389]|nr:hypothetical protein [Flagellimonas sp. 389]MBS9461067.1 hypothetical protein [Flagellimonas sp. 389]
MKLNELSCRRPNILIAEWVLVSSQQNITMEQSAGILKNPPTAHFSKS